ncbi:helix-turn-helix domain-containing protein, partial [Streptomyces hygroscopicus]|uniref:helix-turn-helix domain-containing protein n=1 Tax=Streptomyces hygroscopicus TaxID=1912 RepID=UPI00367CC64B
AGRGLGRAPPRPAARPPPRGFGLRAGPSWTPARPPPPPLTYLTRWRMTLAADLLVEQESTTVANIARAVGYSDPFGFSAAFKRVRGVNPSEFRRTVAGASPAAGRSVPARTTPAGSYA